MAKGNQIYDCSFASMKFFIAPTKHNHLHYISNAIDCASNAIHSVVKHVFFSIPKTLSEKEQELLRHRRALAEAKSQYEQAKNELVTAKENEVGSDSFLFSDTSSFVPLQSMGL